MNVTISGVGRDQVSGDSFAEQRCKGFHRLVIEMKSESLLSMHCLGERGTKLRADELAPHCPFLLCPTQVRGAPTCPVRPQAPSHQSHANQNLAGVITPLSCVDTPVTGVPESTQ